MWYQVGNKERFIDYQKPIIYKKGEQVFLLLPQIRDSYEVVGYNWFNIHTGLYNSSCLFKTPQDAIKHYGVGNIYNAEIGVNTI